jgi:outer membrane receptor protein involved in Fe transport
MGTLVRLALGLTLTPLALPAGLAGQATGRLAGLVIDSATQQPVAGAAVEVLGSGTQRTTDAAGRFGFEALPATTISLRVVAIGYAPKLVTDVIITADVPAEREIVLTPQNVELRELLVTAEASRGSVAMALDEQRYSSGIVTGVSREELARSPDGDAASAVQRLSGATIEDGKYLFVRGLGDRYTTASLNGARIPSPDPERKVVPLDLFPTALLDGITTSKSFTPDQSGDFSGAAVNIRTRNFPARSFASIAISTSYNSVGTGTASQFAPTTGRDWLAAGAAPRRLPGMVAATDFGAALDAGQYNGLVRSFRNVWSPVGRTGSPSAATTVSLGGTTALGGRRLGYAVSGSYNYTETVKADQVRALAATVGSGAASEVDRFVGQSGTASALWGAIANLSLDLGADSRLSVNNSYTRTMDNEARRETGSSENLAIPLLVERTQYIERQVRSSQLEFHHGFAGTPGGAALDGGVTWSGVRRTEPDRSEVVYSLANGTPEWYGFSNEAAVRTFADLTETAVEAHLDLTLPLGPGRVRIGGLARHTARDARNTAYAISLTRALPGEATAESAEQLFADWSDDATGYFRVAPLAAGGSYTAKDNLGAGYAMYLTPLSSRLDLILGARLEHSAVTVHSASTAGEPSRANPEFTDLLPSLALSWQVGTSGVIRASVSQTLSRPEYRELAPILYRDVIGSDNIRGNAALRRALIQNYDLRFELYPRAGELLSVGLFAKQFDDPIERIYQGTSGTRIITYVNADGARNLGVEFELRKRLDWITAALAQVTLFANATVMHSQIRLDPTAGSVTHAQRAMVGQAPYVLNGGLTWALPASGFSVTALYNRVGQRISEAGELPLPDVVLTPRDVLDISAQVPLLGGLDARLDARNLLDTPYRTTQGAVVRESYRSGRTFSVGFTWQP